MMTTTTPINGATPINANAVAVVAAFAVGVAAVGLSAKFVQ